MLRRSWKRVAVGSVSVVALLGVNALARPGRRAKSVSAAKPAALSSSVPAAHRSAAVANADQILGAIVLPAGGSRVAHAPSGAKALFRQRPFVQLFYEAQVDLHQFWVSPASEDSTYSSIRSHLPAGSTFQLSAVGGYDAEYAYELPAVDARVLGIRQLVILLVPLSNGSTAVRIDAQVQYLVPWKPGQRIPATARFLQITKGPWNSNAPRVVATINRRATVRRIAKLVEALPFEGNDNGVAVSCPNASANALTDTFTFRATPQGPVLAKLTEAANAGTSPDLCDDPTLTIRGHRDPPIAGGGQLLTEVDRLLNVHLTAR